MRLGITSAGATRIISGLVLIGLLSSLTASTYLLLVDQVTMGVLQRFDYDERVQGYEPPVRPEWRARIGATWLVRSFHTGDPGEMARRIARMYALGFLLTGVLYIALHPRAAPLMLLGTFAALYYCFTPRAEDAFYPWDAPALVFAALTLLLAVRRQTFLLSLVIVLAVPFKETLLLMALLLLFYEGKSLRERIAWAGATAALGLLLRLVIEHAQGGVARYANFLHLGGQPARGLRLVENLDFLLSAELNHVVFANAGLWLLVPLIPTKDAVLRGFKAVVALFYAGLLLMGSFNEFRIFLEVLPGSLLLLFRFLDREQ